MKTNLSKTAIQEFIQLYKDEFDIELTEKEAQPRAMRLLNLIKNIYRPLSQPKP